MTQGNVPDLSEVLFEEKEEKRVITVGITGVGLMEAKKIIGEMVAIGLKVDVLLVDEVSCSFSNELEKLSECKNIQMTAKIPSEDFERLINVDSYFEPKLTKPKPHQNKHYQRHCLKSKW